VGAIATLVIGFNWGGWNLGSTVEQKVEEARQTAMVVALAPICADKFERAAKGDKGLVLDLGQVSSWQRGEHLMKARWANFVGQESADSAVAEQCADMLSKTLKLK
jgi:hypothetical protein